LIGTYPEGVVHGRLPHHPAIIMPIPLLLLLLREGRAAAQHISGGGGRRDAAQAGVGRQQRHRRVPEDAPQQDGTVELEEPRPEGRLRPGGRGLVRDDPVLVAAVVLESGVQVRIA